MRIVFQYQRNSSHPAFVTRSSILSRSKIVALAPHLHKNCTISGNDKNLSNSSNSFLQFPTALFCQIPSSFFLLFLIFSLKYAKFLTFTYDR